MAATSAAVLAGLSAYAAPVGLGLAAGSQILGGISSYNESRQQASAYSANAKIAMKQAENQAAQERDKYRRLASSQRAAYGASGIDVNSGSPLDVLADTDAEGEISAMQLLYGGQLERANWLNQAKSARASGTSSLIGGILGGVGTGLFGASRLGYLGGGSSGTSAVSRAASKLSGMIK